MNCNVIGNILREIAGASALSKLHIYSNSWENIGDGFLDTTGWRRTGVARMVFA
jgi:hypothetical protein